MHPRLPDLFLFLSAEVEQPSLAEHATYLQVWLWLQRQRWSCAHAPHSPSAIGCPLRRMVHTGGASWVSA